MPIVVNYSVLMNTVKSIGARFIEVPLQARPLDPLEEIRIKIIEGIEIDISDVDINEGGLLNYKGFHVILYIKNLKHYLHDVILGKKKYKFHVADCKTIEKMKMENRFERYAVSQNISGKFRFIGTIDGIKKEADIKIFVCHNCLSKINYKNYVNLKSWNEKEEIVKNFNIADFFSTYSSYFSELPDFAIHDNLGTYPDNWSEISRKIKDKYSWTCQKCNINLSNTKYNYLLHVHHINGVINDNREQNLQVLCKDCHSKSFLHERIIVNRKDRQIISSLRNDQSKANDNVVSGSNSNNWDDILKIADPALSGLIFQMRLKNYELPTVGYELSKSREVISEPVELAWEKNKVAIVLQKDIKTYELFSENGWKILTPSEAMTQWFYL